MKEAFEKVAKDEARKLSIVQEIMIRSTDYLRRIIAPAGRQGGVTMSDLCPHCNRFPMKDYVWWVSGRKNTHFWMCTICGEKVRLEATKTGSWWCKQAKVLIRPKSSEGMHYLRALCGNLINARTNTKMEDGLIQHIVTNLCGGEQEGCHGGVERNSYTLTIVVPQK